MAQVVYSARSLVALEDLVRLLRDTNAAAAPSAVTAIQAAANHLASSPLAGRRVAGELRELVISYGETGSVALYRFLVARDEVRILAIRRQRALGILP